jgi:hypothetical protein
MKELWSRPSHGIRTQWSVSGVAALPAAHSDVNPRHWRHDTICSCHDTELPLWAATVVWCSSLNLYIPPPRNTFQIYTTVVHVIALTQRNFVRIVWRVSMRSGNPTQTHVYRSRPILCLIFHILQLYNKKLRGLSPRANYADRAIAACRRS